MTHRTRSPWWLAIVLVVALGATWWMWPSSDSAAVTASTTAAAATPLPVAQMATPTLASAPLPTSAKPSDTGPSAAPIKLIGTVKAANGADSFALVRRTVDSQVVKVRAGDRIEGMTVSAIESDSIVLSGVAHAVVLEADNAARQVPASPVPVPARPFSPTPPPEPEPEPAYAGDPAPFGH